MQLGSRLSAFLAGMLRGKSYIVRSALEDEVIPTVWEFVPSKQDFDAFPDKTSM